MLDHIGFEVERLRDFTRRLESMGVVFDELYSEGRDVVRIGLTGPSPDALLGSLDALLRVSGASDTFTVSHA
jgi:hypothetical protein